MTTSDLILPAACTFGSLCLVGVPPVTALVISIVFLYAFALVIRRP